MNSEDVIKRLDGIASRGDFAGMSAELAQEWCNAADGIEAVVSILRFMEENPSLEYGAPGPLAHFMEGFLGRGYEQRLSGSIDRKPTTHTLWMLHRVINGTKAMAMRQALIDTMRRAINNSAADAEARKLAAHLFARLSP
jgi:hypothetical protein